jgi:hypothetical protein
VRGRFQAELDGDAQARVSGQHDTGMTQLVGDRLEFVACQQHQRGSAVPAAMSAQDDDRLRVQGDRPAAGFRFQRAGPQLAVDTLLELHGDVGDSLIQVQIIPRQPARLPAPQTRHRDQVIRGEHRVTSDGGQELCQPRRRPHRGHGPLPGPPPLLDPPLGPHHRENGPWFSLHPDGTAEAIDRQNPYHKALSCKMAPSDDMGALAARDAGIPRPAGNRKYFTQLGSVVCVFPALAAVLGAETARSAGPWQPATVLAGLGAAGPG